MDEFVFFLDFRLNLSHGIPDLLTEKLDFAYGFFWTMQSRLNVSEETNDSESDVLRRG